MEKIKEVTLKKALSLLNAIGAQYAIIDSDGNQHGKLQVVEPTKRKKSQYPHGELTSYCVNNFKEIQIGEVCIFPVGKYPIKDMQRCLSSWLCRIYGNATHSTCMSKDQKSIEVLRVA